MSLKNTTTHYGSVTKFIHWLIFLLILGMLVAGVFMQDIPDKALKAQIYNIHKLTGLTILGLMVFRVFWTLANPRPALPADTKPWQRVAERIVQGLIYLTLIAMPISGWVFTSAAGHPPALFGWQLALPIAKSKVIADTGSNIHTAIAVMIVILVSIHIAAALYHYFIKKDDVLQRML